MSSKITFLVFASVIASGCLPGRPMGHFGERAFYHTRDHYRVRYLAADSPRLLPPSWTLETYEHDARGRPTAPSSDPRFYADYRIDHPRRRNVRYMRAERFDLRFVEEDGSAMWSRTMYLHGAWLKVPLARLLAAGVSPMEFERLPMPDLLDLRERRQESRTRLVEEGPVRVDGQEAYFLTFDLETHESRGSVVVSRVTLVGVVPPHGARWQRRELPSLVLFAYTTPPASHDEHRAAFESFVSRVDLR